METGERRTETSMKRRTENGMNGERRPEAGEKGGRRMETGERRMETGERRTENGERRTENGKRKKEDGERFHLNLFFLVSINLYSMADIFLVNSMY